MIVEADITRKIPKEFSMNEMMAKRNVFILDIPMRLMPSSSGNGEAMMIAPITGNIQRKAFI